MANDQSEYVQGSFFQSWNSTHFDPCSIQPGLLINAHLSLNLGGLGVRPADLLHSDLPSALGST